MKGRREEQGLRPGGFGIMLTRKLVDELIYDERGNDVILVKYLDQPAKPTPLNIPDRPNTNVADVPEK